MWRGYCTAARHASSHIFLLSHLGLGLGTLFSSPTPPVRKKRNSAASSVLRAFR